MLVNIRTQPRFQQIVDAVAYRRQQRATIDPTGQAK
jgi:hypothetical protein